ncbi:calmodulin-like 41 [Hibiscus trionum]|uniref:Calmodulin-like 41 n=1 Tax=Hibiscus trionum TaxID=183268 RepID=A0A9W7I6F5_HIBTR|nr:calmodulin-like 41 [Hibiscus trionum]
MEIASISKPPTKWFNKGLRLSLPRLRSKLKSSRSLPPPPTACIPPTLVNNAKEEVLRAVFRRFDSDGDDKISSKELIAYFVSIGDKISTEEAQRVIKDFDNNGDDLMEFKDFVKLMEGDNEGDDIRRAFEMFEVDKGSGCITPVGLQQTLNRLGDVKSYEECVAMIRMFDLDGNGVLDFHEFQQMMKDEPSKIM